MTESLPLGQLPSQNFASFIARQLLYEDHVSRDLVPGQMRAHMGLDAVGVETGIGPADDKGGQPFAAHLGDAGPVHDAVLASATAVRKKCPATCKLVRPPSRGQSQ